MYTIEADKKKDNNSLNSDNIITLDVRGSMMLGKNPFPDVMQTLKVLKKKTLLIINSFEPIPLIVILKRKGYNAIVEKKGDDLFFVYFNKKEKDHKPEVKEVKPITSKTWEELISKYEQ